jgi:murein DD-endopeptidase MepM/ murein hydrolase activator NlpD
MSVGEWLRSASGPRAYALVLTLFGVAACSGDASRLSDNPSAARMGPETTGTISQAQATSARVETRPLPPQTAQVTPVSLGGGRSGIAGGGKGLASYTPSASAGTPVESNNLSAQQSLRPGQQLVIPRYVQGSHSLAAPKTVAAATPLGSNGVHVVAAGETLSKISRTYGTPVADIAKANNLDVNARLSVGDRLIIPGRSSAARGNASAPTIAEHKNVEIASAAEPQENASVYKEVPVAAEGKDSTKSAEATGSLPKFRWPANGRIISAYGPTTNGQQNDGINIAVPENTPVKAAEDGVVAYAGSELKGYGNLVLVRHPNGYVTAYAHAKELLVKRGDQVKRGQVIARSGQSGNVNAPQLHFEIRKGASPLDPTKFLNGA